MLTRQTCGYTPCTLWYVCPNLHLSGFILRVRWFDGIRTRAFSVKENFYCHRAHKATVSTAFVSLLCSLSYNAVKGKARASYRPVILIHHIVLSSVVVSCMEELSVSDYSCRHSCASNSHPRRVYCCYRKMFSPTCITLNLRKRFS